MNARTNEDRLSQTRVNYNAIHLTEDSTESMPPASWPVALQDMKDYLRVEQFSPDDDSPANEFDFDDELIQSMIVEGTRWVEDFTGVHVIPKTLTVYATNGAGLLKVPGPVTGTITIVDDKGVAVTDAEFIGTTFKRMVTVYDKRLTLSYDAGYDDAPDWVKNAIKAYVADHYEFRGDDAPPAANQRAVQICRPYAAKHKKIFA